MVDCDSQQPDCFLIGDGRAADSNVDMWFWDPSAGGEEVDEFCFVGSVVEA